MGREKKGRSLPDWFAAPGDAGFSRLKTWRFWRRMILFFCIFSVVGHLVEYPYCWAGMAFFDSVEPGAEVLTNPFKPFFVYGVGIVFCCVFLEPLRRSMLSRLKEPLAALFLFYTITVLLAIAFELTQGFLQNQPVNGVYPLWDVSDYPGNILGQAWIVNDLLLGALMTLMVWAVLPPCNWLVAHLDSPTANTACAIVALATIVLTLVTYQ